MSETVVTIHETRVREGELWFVWRTSWTGSRRLVGTFADESVARSTAATVDRSSVTQHMVRTDLLDPTGYDDVDLDA